MSESLVPLFPLGLVLLPRMPLPLHIFEERYRLLINRCIDEEREFGVVLQTGSNLQTAGCLARIDSVINRYDDGRLDILSLGTQRFHVLSMHETKSYLEADVEFFSDASSDTPETNESARNAIESLKMFAAVAGYEVDFDVIAKLDFEELSFLLATTDVFSVEQKQKMLESTSTDDRLQLTRSVLAESARRRAMTGRIKEIIGGDADITHMFN